MVSTWGVLRRRLTAVLAAVVVIGPVAACGPDLTKQNWKPTVVPPKPGSGSTEKAPTGPINEPELKPAKLRTVDTCKIMATAIKGVGTATGEPYSDENNECTMQITDTSKRTVTLGVTIDDSMPGIGDRAKAGLSGLPMSENNYDQSCSIEVGTSESPDLGIRTSASVDNGLAPCVAGRKVTANVIGLLKKGGAPQVKVSKGSLLNLDPCSKIDPNVLKQLKMDAATKQEAGLHTCQINSSGPTVNVDFKFGYTGDESGDSVQLQPGVKAYVDSRDESMCDITWKHKDLGNDKSESVDIEYMQFVNAPSSKTLCKNATTLAKSVAMKLPKP